MRAHMSGLSACHPDDPIVSLSSTAATVALSSRIVVALPAVGFDSDRERIVCLDFGRSADYGDGERRPRRRSARSAFTGSEDIHDCHGPVGPEGRVDRSDLGGRERDALAREPASAPGDLVRTWVQHLDVRVAAGGDYVPQRVDVRPVPDAAANVRVIELFGSDRAVSYLPGANAVRWQRDSSVRAAGEGQQREHEREVGNRVGSSMGEQTSDQDGSLPDEQLKLTTVPQQPDTTSLTELDREVGKLKPSHPSSRHLMRTAMELAAAMSVCAIAVAILAGVAVAGTFVVHAGCSTSGGPGVFTPTAGGAMSASSDCSTARDMQLSSGIAPVPAGTSASWGTTAPSGLTIVAAVVPNGDMGSFGVNEGISWGGGFFYGGSGSPITGGEVGFATFMNSSYFGFNLVCGWSTCEGAQHPAGVTINEIDLTAEEDSGPSVNAIGANNLWYQPTWVRGSFPATFAASDVSGVCSTQLLIAGQTILGPGSAPDTTTWHQCSDQYWPVSVNTADYPDGVQPLALVATNAAGVTSEPSGTVSIDNQQPTISESSTDAPNQTQWIGHGATINVTATAGPSGVRVIACSLDGQAVQDVHGRERERAGKRQRDPATDAASRQTTHSTSTGIPTRRPMAPTRSRSMSSRRRSRLNPRTPATRSS